MSADDELELIVRKALGVANQAGVAIARGLTAMSPAARERFLAIAQSERLLTRENVETLSELWTPKD